MSSTTKRDAYPITNPELIKGLKLQQHPEGGPCLEFIVEQNTTHDIHCSL